MLSIVVPTDRETNCALLQMALRAFDSIGDIEVICVAKHEAPSRAARLNLGFHRAQGEIVLFHHPRSFVDPTGIRFLVKISQRPNRELLWGGFTHQFDMHHRLLKFTSWYSNRVRARLRGILYLDHCIFFDRRLWRIDLPNVDIFEDTLLSYEFRKVTMPVVLPYTSTTSAIRFKKNGIYLQAILNQLLKLAFHAHIPHSRLNRVYEGGLELNSKYSSSEGDK